MWQDPVNWIDSIGLAGGRGPSHSFSLKKGDIADWLKNFKRNRSLADSNYEGHDTKLSNSCRELEKFLQGLCPTDRELYKDLLRQMDWCRKKFPARFPDPSTTPSAQPNNEMYFIPPGTSSGGSRGGIINENRPFGGGGLKPFGRPMPRPIM